MPTPGLNLLNQFYGSSGVPNFFTPQGQTPITQTTPGASAGTPVTGGTQPATGTPTSTSTPTAPTENPWGASPWTKGNITRLGNPWEGSPHYFGYGNSSVRPGERNAIAAFIGPQNTGYGGTTQGVGASPLGNYNPYPVLYGPAGVGVPTSAGTTPVQYQNMFRPTSTGSYLGNYISPSIYRNLQQEFDERNLLSQFTPFLNNPTDWMTQYVLPAVTTGDPTAVAQANQITQEEFVNLLTQAMESINQPLHTQVNNPYTYTSPHLGVYQQAEQWIPQLNQILSRLGLS